MLRNRKLLVFLVLLLALVTGTLIVFAAEIQIDHFDFGNQTSQVTWFTGDPLPAENCTFISPSSGTLGGHRDVCVEVTGALVDGDQARLRVTSSLLSLTADSSLSLVGSVQWDGADATSVVDPTGLGGIDLTGGGTNSGILVRLIGSDGVPARVTMRVYTDGSNWAEQSKDFEQALVLGTRVIDLFYPFSSFVNQAGTMNPANVGAVEAEIFSLSPGPDLNIHVITANSYYDFGDLPDTYGTTSAASGARHLTVNGLRLGNSVDSEADGVPSATASGDDNAYAYGTVDDEDGVVRQPGLGGSINNGGWTNGTVASGNGGRLDITITDISAGTSSGVPQVFMDFGSGMVEVTLRNSTGTPLTMPLLEGTHAVYFDIPAGTFDGTNSRSIPTRVRLSSAGGLTATGPAPDGEVEDYIFGFTPTAVSLQSFTPASNSTLPVIGFVGLLALAVVSLGVVVVRREQKRA